MSIAQAVYLISDDDLVENGGHYKVVGRIAIPIHGELENGGGGGDPGDVDVTDLTTDTGSSGQYVRVAPGGGLQYRSPSEVRTDLEIVTQEYIENIFMPKEGGQFWGTITFDPTVPVGSIIPNRLTTAQRDTIVSPPEGLIIYNTTVDELQVYDGSSWKNFSTLSVSAPVNHFLVTKTGGGVQNVTPSAAATLMNLHNLYLSRTGTNTMNGQLKFDPTYPDNTIIPISITTALRDTISAPYLAEGMIIYNTDTDTLEIYAAGAWKSLLLGELNGDDGNIPVYSAGTLVDSGQAPKSLVDGTNIGELVFTDTDNDVSAELVGGILTPGEYGTDGPLVVTVTEHGLISAIEEGTPALPREANIVTISSSRALAAGDAGSIIEATAGATITLPNSLPTGFQAAIANIDGSTITFAAEGTLQSKGAANTLAAQYGMATVYKRSPTIWLLAGDIE